jgi:hypothetical protein
MRTFRTTVIALLAIVVPVLLIGPSAVANPGIMGDFESLYGSALSSKYSCSICHESAIPQLNAYGSDLADAGGFGCQDYQPAATHSILKSSGSCEALHAPGYEQPLASTCAGCHGKTLQGGSAPSCYTCHAKVWSDGGNGSCPDFAAPADHTKTKDDDGCAARHKDGYENPFSSGCTSCHGGDLRGGATGPSCYTCHGNEWDGDDDDDDAPPAAPAFDRVAHAAGNADALRAIESFDSDGDGFGNKEEILALANPGDASSIPGGPKITLKTADVWQRDWYAGKGDLKVTIIFADGSTLAPGATVSLATPTGTLLSPRWRHAGSNRVEVHFPRALLYTLVNSLAAAKVEYSVTGETSSGESFSANGSARLAGAVPNLPDELRGAAKPGRVGAGDTLVLRLSGADAAGIDIGRTIRVIGPFGLVKAANVSRSGAVVEISLPAPVVKRLLGEPIDGARYTLGVRGFLTQSVATFAVPAKVIGSGTGGGGCLDFSPPASHTVARTSGSCTYYHAPGLTSPLSSGCTSCHGSDLKGSSFAPSCTQCHGIKW